MNKTGTYLSDRWCSREPSEVRVARLSTFLLKNLNVQYPPPCHLPLQVTGFKKPGQTPYASGGGLAAGMSTERMLRSSVVLLPSRCVVPGQGPIRSAAGVKVVPPLGAPP